MIRPFRQNPYVSRSDLAQPRASSNYRRRRLGSRDFVRFRTGFFRHPKNFTEILTPPFRPNPYPTPPLRPNPALFGAAFALLAMLRYSHENVFHDLPIEGTLFLLRPPTQIPPPPARGWDQARFFAGFCPGAHPILPPSCPGHPRQSRSDFNKDFAISAKSLPTSELLRARIG